MAKTTAPLLSFGGSGSVAKTLVYSSWKGIQYVRRHVIPANPQTTAQQAVRKSFALLREMWKLAPVLVTTPWNAFAQGRPFTGMNKLVGENVRVLNGELDMANFIGSPGAKGGLPPESVVNSTAGGAGEIEVTIVPPTPPVDWTVTAAVSMVFPDQPPDGIFFGPILALSDAAAPYVNDFTTLEAATDYIVCSWLVWTKPDGTLAYSVGMTAQVTTT